MGEGPSRKAIYGRKSQTGESLTRAKARHGQKSHTGESHTRVKALKNQHIFLEAYFGFLFHTTLLHTQHTLIHIKNEQYKIYFNIFSAYEIV